MPVNKLSNILTVQAGCEESRVIQCLRERTEEQDTDLCLYKSYIWPTDERGTSQTCKAGQ
jgi:hypothetical protein